MSDWIQQPKTSRILHSFSVPRTPRQVERELGIQKLKMESYLSKGLVKSLNPEGRKGRFYTLTDKARSLLKLPDSGSEGGKDWKLIGWVMASPRQRFVVLRTVDLKKRTSDGIMERAFKLDPTLSLTRISTKEILKELISKKLVETELTAEVRKIYRGEKIYGKRLRRFYWLSEKGRLVSDDIACTMGEFDKDF